MTEGSDTWVRETRPVLELALSMGFEEVAVAKFSVPSDAEFFVEVVLSSLSLGLPDELAKHYRPTDAVGEAIAAVAGRVTSGSVEDDVIEPLLDRLASVKVDWPWDVFSDSLEESLHAESDMAPESVKPALRSLAYLGIPKDVEAARLAVELLFTRGHLFHQLAVAHGRSDLETAGLISLALLIWGGGTVVEMPCQASNGQQQWQQLMTQPQGNDVLPFMAGYVGSYVRPRRLVEIGASLDEAHDHVAGLVGELLDEWVDAEQDLADLADPETVIEHYGFLREHVLADRLDLVLDESLGRGLSASLHEYEFDLDRIPLYLSVLEKESPSEVFRKDLLEGLTQVSEEDWASELRGPGDLILLASALVAIGTRGVGTPLADAIVAMVREVLTGQHAMPDGSGEAWPSLITLLSPDAAKVFFRDLRDLMVDSADQPLDAVIDVLGDATIKSKVLGEKAKADDIIRRVFGLFLDRLRPVELRWMAAILKENKNVLKVCKPESRAALVDRVKGLLPDRGPPGAEGEIAQIARAIGLDVA